MDRHDRYPLIAGPDIRRRVRRRQALLLTVAALITLAVALGCKRTPQPGVVALTGDSVTVQARIAGAADGEPGDLNEHAGLGWTAANVAPWVRTQAVERGPSIVITALGVNDAALRNGGWTWADVAAWVDLLDAPHPDACVAVVLPHVGPGVDPAHAAQVDEARSALTIIAALRDGPAVVVDEPFPTAADGVHIAAGDGPHGIDPAAASVRLGTLWTAAAACEGALR